MNPVELKSDADIKGQRLLGDIPEGIGRRLDAARASQKYAKNKWAKQHWQYVIDHLLAQWRIVSTAPSNDVMIQLSPKWKVDSGFYHLDV